MQINNELDELLSIKNTTKRITSPGIEALLYKPIGVLDHGFVRVVDYMGDDSSIVQAARVSYGRGTKKSLEDKGLINYLMRHRHTTPFEMCEIKLHIKLPIFVARQWIRHRTASVNEYSARYSVLGREFYLPEKANLADQSKENRQGRSADVVPDDVAERVLNTLKQDAINAYDHYIDMMNEDENGRIIDENKTGITRELARMNLTLNYYTEWYWKINLHNLMHFVSLRADSHAQYEIRVYAESILDIMKAWLPYTYEAFNNHVINGARISGSGLDVIKKLIRGEKIDQESSNMSKREWAELTKLLDLGSTS